ncbi:MAG: hypothetical protein KGN76_04395 [Acidobacteriota bacterium]|nr:hypothetical protein [Acidobacteriota bacterium]
MHRRAPLIRLLLVGGTAMLALAASPPPARTPVELVLRPYASTTIRTVDVAVGRKTFPFIFDTGGGFTLIQPDEVHDAGCSPFGRVVGFRADGQQIALPRCGPVALDIGGYRSRVEVGVFDLGALLGKGAPPVGGLVGLNAFGPAAVTLDLAHDRVTVETPRSLRARVRDMTPVHVRLVTGAGGDVVPFLEVRARAGTLWMEIDSGNNGPVFLAPHALTQLGLTLPPKGTQAVDLTVAGLGPVTVAAARRAMIYDGQLNPQFLRKMILTIDLGRGRAWAALNSR